ncbi:MAG: type III secretion system export apparatus subunit SctT [Deltaproteobacteria bacterium]|jgi:type III secretion protein T|nr:type III secretion system export apparatus subunit SctT [Deltaproteobacteria bacterium]
MDIGTMISELGVQRYMLAMTLGLPRLSVLILMAPFMGGSIVTGQLKFSLIFALYLVIFPLIIHQAPPEAGTGVTDFIGYVAIAVKESFLGFILAYISGIPFLTAQSAGFLMDNQRGASMASGSDPLSGEETSPLGSFFFQSLVYMFFSSGAFLIYLGVIFQSYSFWPITAWWPDLLSNEAAFFFMWLVVWLMSKMLLLAGPVVASSLLTDISLGIINRFASQLNVYVLAMPIKSALAMLIVLMYYSVFISLSPGMFNFINQSLETLRTYWP